MYTYIYVLIKFKREVFGGTKCIHLEFGVKYLKIWRQFYVILGNISN